MNSHRPPLQTLMRGQTRQHERGAVDVGSEIVSYEMLAVDARSHNQRSRDNEHGSLAGHIMVIVPGHGQTIRGPRKLVHTAALLSKSGIAWCIDPVPARGGDRVEAQAIGRIVQERALIAFPQMGDSVKATLLGWSHGGGEALRAAAHTPSLFPQYLGLCPTGCIERRPSEFVGDFLKESLQILTSSVRSQDWTCLADTLRVGGNGVIGLLRDLGRSRSPRLLVEDIEWATRKVAGKSQQYGGEVVLLFGEQDSVIQWQDVFPTCQQPGQIAGIMTNYKQENFPGAQRVSVQVIAGAHIAPEVHAATFLHTGLGLLQQLHNETVC